MKRGLSSIFVLAFFLASTAGCNLGMRKLSGTALADPCALALARHSGEDKIDQDIRRTQGEARSPEI